MLDKLKKLIAKGFLNFIINVILSFLLGIICLMMLNDITLDPIDYLKNIQNATVILYLLYVVVSFICIIIIRLILSSVIVLLEKEFISKKKA
ncbi:hypothetical protein [Aureivirga marina]|uniref:hypothetical protein n=1 Tax=Aureivirga marina TaxID=1182451 RepID=UPI0018CB724E|nr:hypothetical protein [Aureivirga marina]